MPNPSTIAMQEEYDAIDREALAVAAPDIDYENTVYVFPDYTPGTFESDLRDLINRHSMEQHGGDTPDFMLANFLHEQLRLFNRITRARGQWHNG